MTGHFDRGFTQSHQTSVGMMPYIRPWSIPSTCFPVHYLLIDARPLYSVPEEDPATCRKPRLVGTFGTRGTKRFVCAVLKLPPSLQALRSLWRFYWAVGTFWSRFIFSEMEFSVTISERKRISAPICRTTRSLRDRQNDTDGCAVPFINSRTCAVKRRSDVLKHIAL